jgi:hypothetical protein
MKRCITIIARLPFAEPIAISNAGDECRFPAPLLPEAKCSRDKAHALSSDAPARLLSTKVNTATNLKIRTRPIVRREKSCNMQSVTIERRLCDVCSLVDSLSKVLA